MRFILSLLATASSFCLRDFDFGQRRRVFPVLQPEQACSVTRLKAAMVSYHTVSIRECAQHHFSEVVTVCHNIILTSTGTPDRYVETRSIESSDCLAPGTVFQCEMVRTVRLVRNGDSFRQKCLSLNMSAVTLIEYRAGFVEQRI